MAVTDGRCKHCGKEVMLTQNRIVVEQQTVRVEEVWRAVFYTHMGPTPGLALCLDGPDKAHDPLPDFTDPIAVEEWLNQ